MSTKTKPIVIPVASGRLVFGNDFRCLTGPVGRHDVNTQDGEYNLSVDYSLYGLALVFVGNSCPGVYASEDGLTIKTGGEPGACGHIETDLWWFSAMDADTFARRCDVLGCDPGSFDTFTVNVKPGLHLFSTGEPDLAIDKQVRVLSKNRWVANIEDFNFPQREPDFSPADRFEDSRIWKAASTSRFGLNSGAEEIFTVLGNGFHWHHGQFLILSGHEEDERAFKALPEAKPDEVEAALMDIPVLSGFSPGIGGMKGSYPLSPQYPKLGAAPRNADPNDLAFGMMVARSLVVSDMQPLRQSSANEEVKNNKEVLGRELVAAHRIATGRGLFEDGTMARIFSEIQVAWDRTLAPTATENVHPEI